jgi:hypothetical protein
MLHLKAVLKIYSQKTAKPIFTMIQRKSYFNSNRNEEIPKKNSLNQVYFLKIIVVQDIAHHIPNSSNRCSS